MLEMNNKYQEMMLPLIDACRESIDCNQHQICERTISMQLINAVYSVQIHEKSYIEISIP